MLKHRQEVVAQQKKIEQNLAEVDYKINMYTAPDAEKSVSNEIALAIADKVANHLPNPYEMLQK